MLTFKALGIFLSYPQLKMVSAYEELKQVIKEEDLLPSKHIAAMVDFADTMSSADIYQIQEDYVDTFDRSRSHSLHLFEHVHGESRERGQAMVNLINVYNARGFQIANNELPDFLPLMLEYCSQVSFAEASGLLSEAVHVISAIKKRLAKVDSRYAAVLGAIEALSAVKSKEQAVNKILESGPKDPKTLEELDEEWREAEAFGNDSASMSSSCGTSASVSSFAEMAAKLKGKRKEKQGQDNG